MKTPETAQRASNDLVAAQYMLGDLVRRLKQQASAIHDPSDLTVINEYVRDVEQCKAAMVQMSKDMLDHSKVLRVVQTVRKQIRSMS